MHGSGSRMLDVAPETSPNAEHGSSVSFVTMESVDPVASGHANGRLGRLFAYVSAARLSRSARQRWEAVHAAIRMLWEDADALGRSVTVAQLDQLCGMDPVALQSVLPQLLYYVLTHSGTSANEVRAFLLRTWSHCLRTRA